ncbi:type I-F CRISPR-associated helicase Cas3f [Thiomicrorhabdus hydrogeniphila]
MMVTFVSQCEKNALKKTRRVLDAFANRIGDNTWQTLITQEGLNTVKKLLRQTASKNTAVACHWTRNRHQSELVWIVGKRNKFNFLGQVPVNSTQKNLINTQWENDWRYLPLIKSLTAISALFHDWGKASDFFQAKLKAGKPIADPLRHEWISVLFIVAISKDKTDEEWLKKLTENKINQDEWIALLSKESNPLKSLPSAAKLVVWLILSHHRLPQFKEKEDIDNWAEDTPAKSFDDLLSYLSADWSYLNPKNSSEAEQCFQFSKGLPLQSQAWQKQAKKWTSKFLDCSSLIEESMLNGAWRLILQLSRTALMLGDHQYSSADTDPKIGDKRFPLYANTDRKTKAFKQRLDEHLIGVMQQGLKAAHLLPSFNGSEVLPVAQDVRVLKQKSPKAFQWQDKAVQKIQQWRQSQPESNSQIHYGFFAVNMASTGKGKTFANAKIMRALSENGDSLRYILALGLRTLTLQTGDEYRHRMGLDDTELAVLIGSQAVLELHNQSKEVKEKTEGMFTGSSSSNSLFDEEIDFSVELNDTILSTLLTDSKSQKFLYAPVLSCTIDYLMKATETIKGGRYLLPVLRLLSSDLVIDEIDDFDGKDLVAIARLIHLAGMLGRKVMISSATIPPDLALGLFNAYQTGWHIFSQTRDVSQNIGCAWVDEFGSVIENIRSTAKSEVTAYQDAHKNFINQRIQSLQKQSVKRKACLVTCQPKPADSFALPGEESMTESEYFEVIQSEIIQKHHQHAVTDKASQKHVSFGVVRMANIAPVIALTEFLAEADWPDDIEIRIMPYHSQQILLMRHSQEQYLDSILKRTNEQAIFENEVIRSHLNQIQHNQVIFILVATPVEEVGRDHDFDWAVVEPSSYRSIIQLAGRVLRHREKVPQEANIALLQFNLKGFKSAKNDTNNPVFTRPGYETRQFPLKTHDLKELMDWNLLQERLDATPRIQKPETLQPQQKLADLEHYAIQESLANFNQQGAKTHSGWLTEVWWLTGLPQQANRFREGSQGEKVYAVYEDEQLKYKTKFFTPKLETFETLHTINNKRVSQRLKERLWLERDYQQQLFELAKQKGDSVKNTALKYGELNLPIYQTDQIETFEYSHELGLKRGGN